MCSSDLGSGDSESSVSRLMTAAPKSLVTFMEQMKALTGVDLTKLVPRLLEGDGKTSPGPVPPEPAPPESEAAGEEE